MTSESLPSRTRACQKDVAAGAGLIVSRAATNLGMVSATGVYDGTATLIARLTSGNDAVAGKAIEFLLGGRAVGSAMTNAQGVTILRNVSVGSTNAGVYGNAVVAQFTGGTAYQRNAAAGALTVGMAQANLNVIANEPRTRFMTARRRPASPRRRPAFEPTLDATRPFPRPG